jgi:hypothetical protein
MRTTFCSVWRKVRNSCAVKDVLFEAYLAIILRISALMSGDKEIGGSASVRVSPLPAGPLRSAGIESFDVVGTVSVIVNVELN